MPVKGATGGTVKATASPPTVGAVQSRCRYPKELDVPLAIKPPDLPKGSKGMNETARIDPGRGRILSGFGFSLKDVV